MTLGVCAWPVPIPTGGVVGEMRCAVVVVLATVANLDPVALLPRKAYLLLPAPVVIVCVRPSPLSLSPAPCACALTKLRLLRPPFYTLYPVPVPFTFKPSLTLTLLLLDTYNLGTRFILLFQGDQGFKRPNGLLIGILSRY